MSFLNRFWNWQSQNESNDKAKGSYLQKTYANGDKYCGEMKNGQRNGTGKMQYRNGNGGQYDGEWKDDLKHGKGRFCYANGELYNGDWENDEKSGFGQQFYKNDDIYQGLWQNSKRHGKATYLYQNGRFFEGEYENDHRQGQGVYFDQNKNPIRKELWHLSQLKNVCEPGMQFPIIPNQQNTEFEKQDNTQNSEGENNTKRENFHSNQQTQEQINGNNNNSIDDNYYRNQQNIDSHLSIVHSNEQDTAMRIQTQVGISIREDNYINIDTEIFMQQEEEENQNKFYHDNDPQKSQKNYIGFNTIQVLDQMYILEDTELQNQQLKDWTCEDVKYWLHQHQFGNYADTFEQQQITGSSLIKLTDDDLQKYFNMQTLGERKQFLNLIQNLEELYSQNNMDVLNTQMTKFLKEKYLNSKVPDKKQVPRVPKFGTTVRKPSEKYNFSAHQSIREQEQSDQELTILNSPNQKRKKTIDQHDIYYDNFKLEEDSELDKIQPIQQQRSKNQMEDQNSGTQSQEIPSENGSNQSDSKEPCESSHPEGSQKIKKSKEKRDKKFKKATQFLDSGENDNSLKNSEANDEEREMLIHENQKEKNSQTPIQGEDNLADDEDQEKLSPNAKEMQKRSPPSYKQTNCEDDQKITDAEYAERLYSHEQYDNHQDFQEDQYRKKNSYDSESSDKKNRDDEPEQNNSQLQKLHGLQQNESSKTTLNDSQTVIPHTQESTQPEKTGKEDGNPQELNDQNSKDHQVSNTQSESSSDSSQSDPDSDIEQKAILPQLNLEKSQSEQFEDKIVNGPPKASIKSLKNEKQNNRMKNRCGMSFDQAWKQKLLKLMTDSGISLNFLIEFNELEIQDKIGQGGYGIVYQGNWIGQDVAIKQFGKKEKSMRHAIDFLKEVEVINNLRHPNIVLYMGISLNNNQYYMITEFLEQGSLFDHLHQNQCKIDDDKMLCLVQDIALGMAYLHGRQVLHCDLKSSNVLIDSNWNVKLCDFGLSRIQIKTKSKSEGRVGTPHWMAPEIILGRQYEDYSDVYSFGMILWELITGQTPFQNHSLVQIVGLVGHDQNFSMPIPKSGNKILINLMEMCLKRNTNERPSFKTIVKQIQEGQKQINSEQSIQNQ